VFFVSYARADTEYAPYREAMDKFVNALSACVAAKLGAHNEGICFFDTSSIEAGTVWSVKLADALRSCKVGIALYSPSYFTSQWCGKEFQVFLDRAGAAADQVEIAGVVPVLWMPCTTLPPSVQKIQYTDDTFPPEYGELGIRKLMLLKVYSDESVLAI